jgi:hypothetical protein
MWHKELRKGRKIGGGERKSGNEGKKNEREKVGVEGNVRVKGNKSWRNDEGRIILVCQIERAEGNLVDVEIDRGCLFA